MDWPTALVLISLICMSPVLIPFALYLLAWAFIISVAVINEAYHKVFGKYMGD